MGIRRLGSLGLMLVLLVGCRQIIIVDVGDDTIPEKNRDIVVWMAPYVDLQLPAVVKSSGPLQSRRLQADGSDVPFQPLPDPETLFSFIQLSDVQLRDERVKLYGSFLSGLIDEVVTTNEYDVDQEKYDCAVFLSLVLAINRSVEELAGPELAGPLFLVNTGDSLHSSVLQELWEFLSIIALLELPWIQVIGNHDIEMFGVKLGDVDIVNPKLANMHIGSTEAFVTLHQPRGLSLRPAFEPGIQILPPKAPSGAGANQEKLWAGAHGFGDDPIGPGYYSLVFGSSAEDSDDDDEEMSFDPEWVEPRLSSAAPPFRLIVLNTAEEMGVYAGGIGQDQANWLTEELEKAESKGQYVIVCGHHRLSNRMDLPAGEKRDRVEAAISRLANYPRTLAYFCGHTHKYEYGVVKPTGGGTPFWEIVAPSLLEYPQAALSVKVLWYPGPVETIAFEVVPIYGPFEEAESPVGVSPLSNLRDQAVKGYQGALRDRDLDGTTRDIDLPQLRLATRIGAIP